jgi:hypothetical protein
MDEPKPQVVVTVREDGHVTVRVQGVRGRECVQIARWIEDALGVVEERVFTGEYYEHPAAKAEDGPSPSRFGRG